jgi:ABC-type multidrug transport system ATPase subunit
MNSRFREEVNRGDEVLSVNRLVKQFEGRTVLDGVDFVLYGGDRMALLGANGCGKTTLLKTILSEMTPDEGTVRIGPSIKPGYLPQEITFEMPGRTVIDTLRYAKAMDEEKARNLLAGYRFFADDVFKAVASLSGGEKSRLKLCLLMQEDVNLLILDEPTNHLDLPSREWIEEALGDFGGTILFVSHDRYFIRRFANRIAEMEDGAVTTYQFDYEGYKAWKEWRRQQDAGSAAAAGDGALRTDSARERQAVKDRQRNLGIAERRCAEVENAITGAERRMAAIDREMAEKAADFVLLQALVLEKEEWNRKLPPLYTQWSDAQDALALLTNEGTGT